jgi:peptidylprolyl isomerase
MVIAIGLAACGSAGGGTPNENLTTTASGLKYVDLVVGTGASPAPTDMVTVNYTGTLENGTMFDASSQHGGPASFPLNQVIKGWTEGVGSMKVGGVRKLVIPPDLAYGSQGAGSVIPPNATLTFIVELLDIPKVKIEDTQVGTGAEATVGKSVVVNYTGTLTNGVVFDSSFQRNEPFTLTLGVGQVIPGWEQGLQGMKVGGKRTLTIPPSLAYGAQGFGPIPPNSTLIFDVELLDVK